MSKTKEVEKEISKETEAETTNPVEEVVDKEQTEAPKTETSGDVTTQDITVIEPPEKPKKDGWLRRNWKKVAGAAALLAGGALVVLAAIGKRGDSDDEPEYELDDADVEEISEESDGD